MTEENESYPDTVECCTCKKTAPATARCGSGQEWVLVGSIPPGWFVTDTYPPGDDGLRFACSVQCAENYSPPEY